MKLRDGEGVVVQLWLREVTAVCGDTLQQLQLVNLCCYDECQEHILMHQFDGFGGWQLPELFEDEGWELPELPQLRELRCSFAPLPDADIVELEIPQCSTNLANLQVLSIETYKCSFPWNQHGIPANGYYSEDVIETLTNLQELGKVFIGREDDALGLLSQLTRLSLSCSGLPVLPLELTPQQLPSLKHLTLECCQITQPMVQQLRELTGLTFLRLDTGLAYFDWGLREVGTELPVGWDELGALAQSLQQLRRLELSNCHRSAVVGGREEGGGGEHGDSPNQQWPQLFIPDLSNFTQIKELQLQWTLPDLLKQQQQQEDDEQEQPQQQGHRSSSGASSTSSSSSGHQLGQGQPDAEQEQQQQLLPRPALLLRGLSRVQQLEQMELVGYGLMTPVVLAKLVERLPELKVLKVRQSHHQQQEQQQRELRNAGAYDQASRGPGVSRVALGAYQEVVELCAELRPRLELLVAYPY